jgi:DNA-binding MarR family transcriptional regulator
MQTFSGRFNNMHPMSKPRERERLAAAERVADRLHSAAVHLLRLLREEDLSLGLGPAQLSALSVLVFRGPQSIGELARIEQVAVPTISRLVAALEDAGFAHRQAEAGDRRVVKVSATAAGTRLMQRGRKRRVERLAGLLDGLGKTELASIDAVAEQLAELLNPARKQGN